MASTRLTPLDASFLAVETPTAHMHVGWVALLDPPGRRPSFTELRDHIGARMSRAPRYRQMLRDVPFGLNAPVWVDDPHFDLARHVVEAGSGNLDEVIEATMSEPLPRGRPLWQMTIATRLDDGSVALVGKAHHCMVDGIAAVQLGSLLLDTTEEPQVVEAEDWTPEPGPGRLELLGRGVAELARDQLRLAALPARIASSPRRAGELAGRAQRSLAAIADSARPARIVEALNGPISPHRHLGRLDRPLDELLEIKRGLGVTLNDVVLAASTSAVRRFFADRGDRPVALKAMVPVSVRAEDDGDSLGNRISFMFVDLPCDEPDPIRRLRGIHADTGDRKRDGTPEGGDEVLGLLGFAPSPIHRALSRLIAGPRAFNLVVSNIPGPRGEIYMRGCKLRCAYPVVPLADRHALSIGFTTAAESACFGLYADRDSLPDVDDLAVCLDSALDELLELARPKAEERPSLAVLS